LDFMKGFVVYKEETETRGFGFGGGGNDGDGGDGDIDAGFKGGTEFCDEDHGTGVGGDGGVDGEGIGFCGGGGGGEEEYCGDEDEEEGNVGFQHCEIGGDGDEVNGDSISEFWNGS
jgi:hypothetical protein